MVALGLLAGLGILWVAATARSNLATAHYFCADLGPDVHLADSPAPLAELPEWKFQSFISLPEAPEPSGLCFSPERKVFYLVDDGDSYAKRPARLWELNASGKAVRSLDLGRDLEGVCWAAGLQLIFIADEWDDKVYAVTPDDFKVFSSVEVSENCAGRRAFQRGGNGFEGIEYLPPKRGAKDLGSLLLLNQDDPTCIGILPVKVLTDSRKHQKAECIRIVELQQINAGELRITPDGKELWIVHSWMNVTEILDPDTFGLKAWEVMPGSAQEGLAFDDQGRMWVGQDTGGLAVYVRETGAS